MQPIRWREPVARDFCSSHDEVERIEIMPDMGTIGFSFSPDVSNRMRQSFNNGVLPLNASEALRILSLHLPVNLSGSPAAGSRECRASGAPRRTCWRAGGSF